MFGSKKKVRYRLAETGWHGNVVWQEGGRTGIGRGRMLGEKRGGGVGIIIREKNGRFFEEIKLKDDGVNLGRGKGDIITVKVTEKSEIWWITVVYMGVENPENREGNKKLYKALEEMKEMVGDEKWIILGDFNGHVGMKNEAVNKNGEMLLDFTETAKLTIQNWDYEELTTWKGNGVESVIDYVLTNEATTKCNAQFWTNENVDISDHIMIGVTVESIEEKERGKKKVNRVGKWNLTKAKWQEYRQEIDIGMQSEGDIRERTVNQWEKDIKERITKKAEKLVGRKKINTQGKKLKGWWDEEVKVAIKKRKEANRIQRKLKRDVEKGEAHVREWEAKWEEYIELKKTSPTDDCK